MTDDSFDKDEVLLRLDEVIEASGANVTDYCIEKQMHKIEVLVSRQGMTWREAYEHEEESFNRRLATINAMDDADRDKIGCIVFIVVVICLAILLRYGCPHRSDGVDHPQDVVTSVTGMVVLQLWCH